jgi:hypothetical protein
MARPGPSPRIQVLHLRSEIRALALGGGYGMVRSRKHGPRDEPPPVIAMGVLLHALGRRARPCVRGRGSIGSLHGRKTHAFPQLGGTKSEAAQRLGADDVQPVGAVDVQRVVIRMAGKLA